MISSSIAYCHSLCSDRNYVEQASYSERPDHVIALRKHPCDLRCVPASTIAIMRALKLQALHRHSLPILCLRPP